MTGGVIRGSGSGIHIALLDRAGVIVAVNASWEEFAAANGGSPETTGPGRSYLAVCDAGHDAGSARVAAAIRRAIDGRQAVPTRVRLPCHSPTERRWIDIYVAPRLDDDLQPVGATVTVAPAAPELAVDRAAVPAGGAAERAAHDGFLSEAGQDFTRELFTATMSLSAVANHVTDPVVHERLTACVRALDATIRRLRSVIVASGS